MTYDFMDYMPEYTRMNFYKFKDFSPDQKKFILAENKKYNGRLMSDADPAKGGEDHFTFLDGAPGEEDSPEIDHIFPKSKGGTNQYLNARVISRKLNNFKRAKVS